jgi:hypothetical protein
MLLHMLHFKKKQETNSTAQHFHTPLPFEEFDGHNLTGSTLGRCQRISRRSGSFGPISGADVLLGLPSKATTSMPVHALCCIARKARVFDFLKTWIARFLDGGEEHKTKLEKIIEHSPNIAKKPRATRIVFWHVCWLFADWRKITWGRKVFHSNLHWQRQSSPQLICCV